MRSQEVVDYIDSLMGQLDKLLKVINHSDPTAENKKVLLYRKYQENLKTLAQAMKPYYSWQEVQDLFENQIEISSKINQESRSVILDKIVKDLEKHFIEEHVLTEFEAPKRILKKKKPPRPQIAKKTKVPFTDKYQKQYTKENIMEMVQMTQKQVVARSQLKVLISKIKQLDPNQFESKINEYLKKDKGQ